MSELGNRHRKYHGHWETAINKLCNCHPCSAFRRGYETRIDVTIDPRYEDRLKSRDAIGSGRRRVVNEARVRMSIKYIEATLADTANLLNAPASSMSYGIRHSITKLQKQLVKMMVNLKWYLGEDAKEDETNV